MNNTSLVQAMYRMCLAYKEMESSSTVQVDQELEAALVEMNEALSDICKAIGLTRAFLEKGCY